MLRLGTFSYWYGVLHMIVVRIDPSTYIITLFPYDITIWYIKTGTGNKVLVPYRYRTSTNTTVRYNTNPYGAIINYGTVQRYLFGTHTIKLTIQLTV